MRRFAATSDDRRHRQSDGAFATGAQTRGGGVSGATIRPSDFCGSATSGWLDRFAAAISIRGALLAGGVTHALPAQHAAVIPELHGDDRGAGTFVSHCEWCCVRSPSNTENGAPRTAPVALATSPRIGHSAIGSPAMGTANAAATRNAVIRRRVRMMAMCRLPAPRAVRKRRI